MTAPDERPGERGQRVSELVATLNKIAGNTYRVEGQWPQVPGTVGFGYNLGSVMVPVKDWQAVIESIEAYRDSRATIADLTAEIERLREALATARRDGWIEGRDAAAKTASSHSFYACGDCKHRGIMESDTGYVPCRLEDEGECVCAARLESDDALAKKIRALAPAEAEGKSDA